MPLRSAGQGFDEEWNSVANTQHQPTADANGGTKVDDENFYEDIVIDEETGPPRRLSVVSAMLHQRHVCLVGVGLMITLLLGASLGAGISRRSDDNASTSPAGNKLGPSFRNGNGASWGLAATSARYLPIRDALVELHGGDRAPFASIDTHHHQALIFLADEDPRKISADDPSLAQRFALAMFFYSTLGMTWKSKVSWMTGEDECLWEGVSCSRDGIHVDELSLPDNGIKGVMGDLSLLRYLQRLDLSNNTGLDGTYLHDSLGKLNNLHSLHLHHCGITGEIPGTLWSSSRLELIDISYNDLSGSIPPTIRNSASLQKLLLEGNRFSGQFPHELSDLPLLNEIRCGDNKFVGQLPSLSRLHNLRVLSFFSNDLTGTLPSISKDYVRVIDLSKNNLVGVVGTKLNDMPELMELKLSNNFFSDDLNDQVDLSSNLNLELLHLNGNKFRGDSFPAWIAPLISLREFYLFGNGALHVEGAIPDEVCDLVDFVQSVEVLAVDCNNVQCTCCTHCCTALGVCQLERPEENAY